MAQTVKRLPTMRETQVRSLYWKDPLEKEMATHSSTLAWKIPWTEERGRVQSMRSLRVGYGWVTSLSNIDCLGVSCFYGEKYKYDRYVGIWNFRQKVKSFWLIKQMRVCLHIWISFCHFSKVDTFVCARLSGLKGTSNPRLTCEAPMECAVVPVM